MAIEMPRGLPFAVDTFGPYTTTTMKRRKRHHFLTHAHKDHTVGISPSNVVVFPIYSTSLTISLLLQRHPQLDESCFVRIEIGQSVVVDDQDGDFKVTAFDANHCPGAVMFLFEGSFGNILHTGDCRLTLDCLQNLPEKFVGTRHGLAPKCSLDFIFLDCTFGKASHSQRFPSKHSAIRQIINCIWNHPNAPVVYLACDMLGQEDVLLEVSRTFGSKIYVDKATNLECFRSLMVTYSVGSLNCMKEQVQSLLRPDRNFRMNLLSSALQLSGMFVMTKIIPKVEVNIKSRGKLGLVKLSRMSLVFGMCVTLCIHPVKN